MMTSLYGSQSRSFKVGAFILRLLWTKCEDVITMRDCPNNEANDEGIAESGSLDLQDGSLYMK